VPRWFHYSWQLHFDCHEFEQYDRSGFNRHSQRQLVIVTLIASFGFYGPIATWVHEDHWPLRTVICTWLAMSCAAQLGMWLYLKMQFSAYENAVQLRDDQHNWWNPLHSLRLYKHIRGVTRGDVGIRWWYTWLNTPARYLKGHEAAAWILRRIGIISMRKAGVTSWEVLPNTKNRPRRPGSSSN